MGGCLGVCGRRLCCNQKVSNVNRSQHARVYCSVTSEHVVPVIRRRKLEMAAFFHLAAILFTLSGEAMKRNNQAFTFSNCSLSQTVHFFVDVFKSVSSGLYGDLEHTDTGGNSC